MPVTFRDVSHSDDSWLMEISVKQLTGSDWSVRAAQVCRLVCLGW